MAELFNSTRNLSANVPYGDENPSVRGNIAQNEASGRTTHTGASYSPSKAAVLAVGVISILSIGIKVMTALRSNDSTHNYDLELPSDLDVAVPPLHPFPPLPPRPPRTPFAGGISAPPRIRGTGPPSAAPVTSYIVRPHPKPPVFILHPDHKPPPDVFSDLSFSLPGIIQTPSFTETMTDEFIDPFFSSSDGDEGVSSMSMRTTNDIISAPEVDYYDDVDLGSR